MPVTSHGDGHASRRRATPSLRATLSSLGLTALLTFLIGYLDLLGLHGNLENLSDRIEQRILAPVSRNTKGQNDVSVVLIDKRFLDSAHNPVHWPLPVNFFLLRVLDPIVHAQPAAVFIDISFTDMPRTVKVIDTRSDIQAPLEKLAEGIRNESKNVPLFLADVIAPQEAGAEEENCPVDWIDPASIEKRRTTSAYFIERAFGPRMPNVAPGGSGLELVAANWSGPDKEYPTHSMIVSAPASCRSVAQSLDDDFAKSGGHSDGGTANAGTGYLVTPAVALLKSLCDHPARLRDGPADADICSQIQRNSLPGNQGYGLYNVGVGLEDPIKLRWGTRLSATMRKHFKDAAGADNCLAQFRNGFLHEEIAQIAATFLPRIFDSGESRASQRHCAFVDSISAADLDDEKATDFLKGRAVLIGTNLAQAPDVTQSPVNDEMPGVYLHATALENLLSLGTQYPRSLGTLGNAAQVAIEAILVALLGLAISRFLHWLERNNRLPRHESAAGIATFFALWLALSLAIFVGLPTLWFGVIRLIGVAYVGNPFYVALATILVMTEEMRLDYFSQHGSRHS